MLSEENRKKIIFAADDFGVSLLADANILKLAMSGKLDRVEIMISDNLRKEAALALKKTGVKLDIHLHLIESSSDYWRGNRNLKEGALKRILFFGLNYIFGRSSPQKVALIWEEQIKKFKEVFGEYPTGLGSHEYIHYFTPYFKVALALSEKYQISFVRFGARSFKRAPIINRILNWLRQRGLVYLKKTKLKTSAYMLSFDWFGHLEFLSQLPIGSQVEVVFHPERAEEMRFLEHGEFGGLNEA